MNYPKYYFGIATDKDIIIIMIIIFDSIIVNTIIIMIINNDFDKYYSHYKLAFNTIVKFLSPSSF